MKNPVKRVAWVSAIAMAFGLAVAPMATASGVGNTVNGCTAQWFSTAFSLNCRDVSSAGYYQSKGNCSAQVDRNGRVAYLNKGTTRNGVSSEQCRFSVTSASAHYLGS
ncbi:hypothetical protein [Cellulomonas bogoriensis]|uniref:hypothetical protein n=1 Tax=Cellulomonas bogoriensis TaxID=301388 RepID=UPI0012EC6191|nr:hypothetical protein [Cellulomonas bogoriensis]